MRKIVGKIVGDTSPLEFNFVVLNPKLIKKGDYIKVWNEFDGWILAYVADIKATTSAKFKEIRESTKEQVLIGKAIAIGKREDKVLKVPRSPFLPGERIYLASEDLIRETLGINKRGLYIGLLGETDIKVKLDTNSTVQKHVCILAKTGSGKSYAASVLIEELLEKKVPVLIVDPHGEYKTLGEPGNLNGNEFGIEAKGYKVKVYTPQISPFSDEADERLILNSYNLSFEELLRLTEIKNPTLQGLLYQVIRNLTEDYSIEDVIGEVENLKHPSKWTLIGALARISDSGLFGKKPTNIKKLLSRGQASIIDLRGVDPIYQDLIVSHICTEIFELRKRGMINPGMIVIEEAHNFIPERGFGKALSTKIIRTIASEGRKFGLGLMIISQRPARVDKNVISQCNTQIVLKLTNPNDLDAIKKGVEGITHDMIEEIKCLPTGRAMVISPELERPIIVRIRRRKSRHQEATGVIKEEKKSFWRRLFG